MPRRSTTNSWRFPPRTREVQVDEKWGYVYRKEASCDPLDPSDRLRGDDWDHTAVDPESRMLLALVPGKRDGATCERLIRQVHDRTGGRTDLLITSDEHAPYETSIHEVYGVEQPRPRRPGPGRPPRPVKVVPADLCYATVRKRREKGRVVEVVEYCQMSLMGNFQAAGFSLIPSMNLVPRTTSVSNGDPFNDRQPFDADSINLNTIVRHAVRVPLPLVLSCLSRTVENTLSIGFVVRMCTQCSPGKS